MKELTEQEREIKTLKSIREDLKALLRLSVYNCGQTKYFRWLLDEINGRLLDLPPTTSMPPEDQAGAVRFTTCPPVYQESSLDIQHLNKQRQDGFGYGLYGGYVGGLIGSLLGIASFFLLLIISVSIGAMGLFGLALWVFFGCMGAGVIIGAAVEVASAQYFKHTIQQDPELREGEGVVAKHPKDVSELLKYAEYLNRFTMPADQAPSPSAPSVVVFRDSPIDASGSTMGKVEPQNSNTP